MVTSIVSPYICLINKFSLSAQKEMYIEECGEYED